MAVITAHGELDAANAQQFVDYALRYSAHIDRLVLDSLVPQAFPRCTA
jgi:anti-anti-sigma regulatory factor